MFIPTQIGKHPHPPASYPSLPPPTDPTRLLLLGYSAPDPAMQQDYAGQAWASRDFGVEPSERTSHQESGFSSL